MSSGTPEGFANFHTHTDHSPLDGAGRVDEYFAEAAALGQGTLGITDHGTMSSHWDAYRAGKKHGVKPALGIEAYVAPDTRHVQSPVYWGTEEQRREDVSGKGAYLHLTMFALNSEGLRNLYQMQYYAATEGFYRNPRIDFELMSRFNKGIYVTTGCPGSGVSTRYKLGQEAAAVEYAATLRDIYGDNLAVEVMRHGMDLDDLLIPFQVRLARQLNLPLIATNDCHYVQAKNAKAQDAFLALQTKRTLDDPNRFRFDGHGYHLKSTDEMRQQFTDLPEAISNTLLVAERVESYDSHFEFKNRMPHPVGVDPDFEDEALAEMVDRALAGYGPEYRARAHYELEIIARMGFSGYFLVLADIIGWAKSQGIRVGPGRGSAGGSLVCFLVGITGIDPITHGLPFERFLNPDRVSMPDIDIDFEITRRDEVVEYTKQRFGREHVAKIATFGTIKAKMALKDATRLLGHDFDTSNMLTKLYPQPIHGFQPTLSCVFNPEDPRYGDAKSLRAAIENSAMYREIYDLACGLEGLIRQTGMHAAGMIISSDSLKDVVPLKTVDGELVTSFDQPALEPMGLIKYDFLGLENLTVIDRALENIERLYGKTVIVEDLPLTDPKTFQMLADGKSLGVFQLDGSGMQRLLKRLRPTQFEDISAVLALYRPGPMGVDAHNLFADRKNGRVSVEPIHPEFAEALRDILEPTYGVIVYQEQVMAVLQKVAGYTPGQSDNVRRIMGKKKPAEMAKLEPELREKLKEQGYSDEAFQVLWDTLVPFADYSFNKAHTAAYGLISYWTAYLKANYPIAYFAALLSSENDDQDNLTTYMNDARRMGVPILPPDINESDYGFTPTQFGIRFGLGAIKQVGPAVIDEVRKQRYGSLTEFYGSISDKVNLGALRALIASGAFDAMGDRSTHFEKAQIWLEMAKAHKKARANGDILITNPGYKLPREQSDKAQMRSWESEYLGTELTESSITVNLSRSLSDAEWAWVHSQLAAHPGTQRVQFKLQDITFLGSQRVAPSAKLARALRALDALGATID